MENPIIDPPIPYVGPIYRGRFSPGKMVRIQGTTPGVAYKFHINLQCGPETSPRSDVAIHVSVRILESCIVLNSLQNGVWHEEQCGNTMPIKRAEKFEVTILSDFSNYKVAINGQHYCEFPQRIHYDRISHLAIDGDVSIIQISYESTPSAPTSGIPQAQASGYSPNMNTTAPLLPQDENDTFEIIDANERAPIGIRAPPPAVGFSQPPPYSAVVSSSHMPSGSPYHPTTMPMTAPYPTGEIPGMPKAAPYPTGAIPGMPNTAPYPTSTVPGMPNMTPYPTGLPGVTGSSPYPPPGAPIIPPPPPGAPIPLNAGASSNFRSVKQDNSQACKTGFGAALIIIIIVVAVIVISR